MKGTFCKIESEYLRSLAFTNTGFGVEASFKEGIRVAE